MGVGEIDSGGFALGEGSWRLEDRQQVTQGEGSQEQQPGKVPLHPPGISPFFYSGDSLSQPPPAHMGIPSYPLDPKPGMARAPVYPFTPVSSHCAYPPLGAPDLPPWNSPALYPSTSGAFRSAYSGLPSSLHRFSPGLLPHSLPPHLLHPEYLKHNGDNRHNADVKPVISAPPPGSGSKQQQTNVSDAARLCRAEKKKCHIKKPLNAFMLYMKEMRAKVVAECTLKESAAINQILGRRWSALPKEEQAVFYEKARIEKEKWHALNRDEQSKYYEMARKERQLHMQMYPGWSARDNYAQSKKKKRKRDKVDGAQMKKCRARYGLEQQDQWCKPCRRKKKCIRYMEDGEGGGEDGDGDGEDATDDEDGMDSSGNGDDAQTPNSGSTDDQAATNSPSVSMSSLASPGYSVTSLLSPSPMAPSPKTPGGVMVNGVGDAAAAAAAAPVTSAGSGGSSVPSPAFQQPRTPVGANPRDVNNPLSVGQLTNSSPRPCQPLGGPAGAPRTGQPPAASCVSVT
ncbi:protein pangolin, isoforms A/H/I/S-like isoform X4 [Amphibalanus amphitrite]|uniref:protein pangolin, isoforms A/H/I/S-like isoform X4 n=1 Tax=Amphibalanus amphitrite TaxID=1232801 RepID=UPI001C92029E|nr:protein pangolin, isoforms A/H/I/S-like isoform X4 [Amphibalanus amphitrite]